MNEPFAELGSGEKEKVLEVIKTILKPQFWDYPCFLFVQDKNPPLLPIIWRS